MQAAVVGTVLLTLLNSVYGARELYVCDSSTTDNRLPSIVDSLAAVLRSGGGEVKDAVDSFLFAFDDSIPSLLKQPIPVANWFTDGVYTFNFHEDAAMKANLLEVNLLQQDTRWSLTRAPFCMLQWHDWCTCATTPVSDLAKLHFEDQVPCVTKLSKSVPEYLVDPSRPSCLQLVLADGAPPIVKAQYAHYSLAVPTADTVLLKELLSRALRDVPEAVSVVLGTLNHLPLYLLSLAVGLCLTFYASEIAEEKTFQIALQVFLGLFTALVVLLVVAHRIVSGILTRHSSSVYMPRIVDSLFGFSLLSVAYQYRYFLLGQSVDMLFKFWDEGAFGYWWLGRVYFAVCIFASLAICHVFDLFRDPDSRSFFIALLACRALGVLFLLHSSSSAPVAWTLTALTIASSPLKSYFHYFYFALAGYLQPKAGSANVVVARGGVFSSPSVRKLSRNEADALVKSTTAREMEKLRKFLKDHPQELAKFDQTMREDNKETTANLVGQFASNLYSGRPRPQATAPPMSWWRRALRLLRDLSVLVVLGGVVAVFTLNADTLERVLSEVVRASTSSAATAATATTAAV